MYVVALQSVAVEEKAEAQVPLDTVEATEELQHLPFDN